ncbi:MAG: hypothetical protein K0S08_177 [Gammaproteobacteria bacterium]|jgi:hypothetical protein|nr:hypothetical protein [Gammaproteobacteria bacterium]
MLITEESPLIQETIAYVKSCIPLKSGNLANDNQALSKEILTRKILVSVQQGLELLSLEPIIKKAGWYQYLQSSIEVYKRHGFANCQGQAMLAFDYLLSKGFTNIHIIKINGPAHHFVVLNMSPKSQLDKPHTWGAGCIIIDPWISDTCKASEFEKFRDKHREVKYAPSVYMLTPNIPHFLEGNMEFFASASTLYMGKELGCQLTQIAKKYSLSSGLMHNRDELNQALRRAAASGDARSIVALTQIKALNINAQDTGASKRTALHWAVIKDKAECCEVLMHFDAKTDIPDSSGKSAKDYALESQNKKICAILNLCETKVSDNQVPALAPT